MRLQRIKNSSFSMRLNDNVVLQFIPLPIINYTNCIYFLVHLPLINQ
jgi:hypothetical protein